MMKRKVLMSVATVLCAFTGLTRAGETLYNGIELPDEWPPKYPEISRDPMPVPYLDEVPEIVSIDVGRQLFVDDFLVEESTLSRTFHQPEYHEEPVITPEEDTAGMYAAPFSGGACYDPADKLFKMWYTRVEPHATCYATSKDGIHWEKPELDVEAGTNIVLNPDGFNSSAIMLDQWAKDPNERFKYFASERTEGIEGWFAGHRTSADGIHWSELKGARPKIWGDRSTAFYNPFRTVWVFSQRTEDENGWRARSYVEGPTAEEMLAEVRYNELDTVEGKSVHWAGADELDPHHTDARFAHIEPQLYTLDASPYESIMLGQFSIWQGPENDLCGEFNIQKQNDILLGFSRDGFHWDRPNRKRFIEGTWDRRGWRYGNVQSCAAGPLVVGDKLYFYFSAHPAPKSERWDTDATTGLAILRRDGFASLDAGGRRGTLTTRPVAFKGKHLFVNVDCPDGELKVEVLDEDSQVIDGFSIENAKPIATDKTLVQVNWEQDKDLAALAGKPVRFRFHLTNGSLYAFWVSPDASGASHGYVGAGGPGYTGPTDTVGKILAADLPQREEDGGVASGPFEIETPAMPDPIPDTWLTYHLAHPGPTKAVPGDPNCAIYYKGKYHMHYIYDSHGASFAHVTSDDMVNWKWQETVLTEPLIGHGMFSGTAFLTKEGKAAIMYHGAGADRNYLAFAENDALSQWTKPMAVEPTTADGKPAEMRHWDPDCWLMGDTYYALSGGEDPTIATSKDLKNWLFQGKLFHQDFPEDLGVAREEDVSCANMFKLGDKWMMLCISHGLGARYYLGDFKDGKFQPDHHSLLNWAAWDLFAPESLLTPDGRRVMWAWSTPGVFVDQRVERTKSFDRLVKELQSGIQSLPRELSLDDDGMLEIRPLRELSKLRTHQKELKDITIKSGDTQVLKDMEGDTIELEVVFDAPKASEFGLRILANAKGENGFKIASGTDRDTITLDYVEPPFSLKEGEDLTLRIFIDKGMIEVFANDRQAAVAWHDYEPENQHIALYANGAEVKVRKVTCWSMKSIY